TSTTRASSVGAGLAVATLVAAAAGVWGAVPVAARGAGTTVDRVGGAAVPIGVAGATTCCGVPLTIWGCTTHWVGTIGTGAAGAEVAAGGGVGARVGATSGAQAANISASAPPASNNNSRGFMPAAPQCQGIAAAQTGWGRVETAHAGAERAKRRRPSLPA